MLKIIKEDISESVTIVTKDFNEEIRQIIYFDFDKSNIRFNTAATDIFTSAIEVQSLVKEIKYISSIKFNGIINIGKERKSDFENYKKFKKNIKPCRRKDILEDLGFKIAKDASMNLSLLKKLKRKLWKKSL